MSEILEREMKGLFYTKILPDFADLLRQQGGEHGEALAPTTAEQYMVPVRTFVDFLFGGFPRAKPIVIDLE